MFIPKIILAFALFTSSASISDLDGLLVRHVKSLTHVNRDGTSVNLGVEVMNIRSVAFQLIVFECVGYVDGVPISQGTGTAETVGANRVVFSYASLYHSFLKRVPTTASCRVIRAHKYE